MVASSCFSLMLYVTPKAAANPAFLPAHPPGTGYTHRKQGYIGPLTPGRSPGSVSFPGISTSAQAPSPLGAGTPAWLMGNSEVLLPQADFGGMTDGNTDKVC